MVKGDKLLGRYSMQERVASGGMGAVWRARDEKLARDVAVKILAENLAHDERFVERFRREARSVAGMTHPNIATVFDFGEDKGRYFIVMELVEGKDLARILREEGPLSSERTIRIGTQICAALTQAHGAGVVHRDIKPGNVIVAPDDTAKVTDFGIARATGDSTLTGTGSVLGTAQYISPEQAAGSKIGPASDIYSLGIVLYEMLTGTVPFTGDSAIGVAMRHMNEDVPAPSALSERVSPELDDIVARATARSPEERWPDAASMRAALVGAGEGIPTGPVTTGMAAGIPITTEERVSAGTTAMMTPDPTGAGSALRWGLAALGALAAIALVLLLVRAFDSPDPVAQRRERVNRIESPSSKPSGYLIENLQGRPFEDVKLILQSEGLVVAGQPVESEEEEGLVVSTAPPTGSTLNEGDSITVNYSASDDDEGGGKGKGRGKGKGKGKDKNGEDGEEDD